jgi:hypothetical protein
MENIELINCGATRMQSALQRSGDEIRLVEWILTFAALGCEFVKRMSNPKLH